MNDSIIAEREDVEAGFQLYYGIAEANEMGLSPEIYTIYQKIKPYIPNEGITRNDFQTIYLKEFHKQLGSKRSLEILSILTSCGLLIEDLDPQDKRKKRYYLTEKFLPPTQGENISIPEIYAKLREKLTHPFYMHEAVKLIREIRQCETEEAQKIFETFHNEGKIFLNPYGLWEWTHG